MILCLRVIDRSQQLSECSFNGKREGALEVLRQMRQRLFAMLLRIKHVAYLTQISDWCLLRYGSPRSATEFGLCPRLNLYAFWPPARASKARHSWATLSADLAMSSSPRFRADPARRSASSILARSIFRNSLLVGILSKWGAPILCTTHIRSVSRSEHR